MCTARTIDARDVFQENSQDGVKCHLKIIGIDHSAFQMAHTSLKEF
jgi:hypothetical protein